MSEPRIKAGVWVSAALRMGSIDGKPGMVVRKGSSEPIHFASITLTNGGDEQRSLHGVTAADGRFAFKDVPPGDYRVTVTRNGYVSESYGARRAMDPGLPLTLSSGKHVDDLIFRMTPAAVIMG